MYQINVFEDAMDFEVNANCIQIKSNKPISYKENEVVIPIAAIIFKNITFKYISYIKEDFHNWYGFDRLKFKKDTFVLQYENNIYIVFNNKSKVYEQLINQI